MAYDPTQLATWKKLEEHKATIADVHMRDLFAEDPQRGPRMTEHAAGIELDYSKNRVTDETMNQLMALARLAVFAARYAPWAPGSLWANTRSIAG